MKLTLEFDDSKMAAQVAEALLGSEGSSIISATTGVPLDAGTSAASTTSLLEPSSQTTFPQNLNAGVASVGVLESPNRDTFEVSNAVGMDAGFGRT